jgi:hypothetical protein
MRPGPLILRFGQWRIERIKTGLVRRTKVGCSIFDQQENAWQMAAPKAVL